MTRKTVFTVCGPSTKALEVEAHTTSKLKRLIVTREHPAARRTITHRLSGYSMISLLPITMRTIPQLIAFAEALEAMDHPAWAIFDGLSFGKPWDRSKLSGRETDLLRDFASKARELGISVMADDQARAG